MNQRDQMRELEPCPFCGSTPELSDGIGTQYEIECTDCCQSIVGIQICDLMTIEERKAETFENCRYSTKYVERAKQEAIKRWNTRAHVNETPKNEHDSDDVLNKTGNVNMMREALRQIHEEAHDRYRNKDGVSPIWILERTQFALHAAEPAPLVRLTDEEIWKLWHELPQPTGKYAIARYAEEIMDAMQRVNRRQLDQTPNSPSE